MLTLRSGTAWDDLERYERQVYSENGEDGIIERLLDLVGVRHHF